jgi:chitinase
MKHRVLSNVPFHIQQIANALLSYQTRSHARRILWITCAVLFIFGVGNIRFLEAQSPQSSFVIAGYLPEYRSAEVKDEWFANISDLILFSAEPSESGELDLSRLDSQPWRQTLQGKHAKANRKILSIGGWGRSKHFPKVCGNESLQSKFVAAIRSALEQEGFQGVDFDWEHPQSQTEEQGYERLLKEIRAALSSDFTISITMAPWQKLSKETFTYVDRVQIMAYDNEGEHSTLEDAKQAISQVRELGAPRRKIVLGIPLYGRDINTKEAKAYRELISLPGFQANKDMIGSMYFNNRATVIEKIRLARSEGLAGVMFWEISQDASGKNQSLLRSAFDEVNGWSAK